MSFRGFNSQKKRNKTQKGRRRKKLFCTRITFKNQQTINEQFSPISVLKSVGFNRLSFDVIRSKYDVSVLNHCCCSSNIIIVAVAVVSYFVQSCALDLHD